MFFKKLVLISVVLCFLIKISQSEKLNDENLTNKMNWSCVNNASCINNIANKVIKKLSRNESVNLGFMSIKPIETKSFTGRGTSRVLDFLSGHAVQVPVGPMVFNIQRADDYDNYLEISLLKKTEVEGISVNSSYF